MDRGESYLVNDGEREAWLLFLFAMCLLFALVIAYAWQRALQ